MIPSRADTCGDREDYMHARGFDYVHETTGPQAATRMSSYITDEWKRKGLWETFAEDYRRREEAAELLIHPSPMPADDYLDSYVGRRAVEFVEAYDEQRPMCLYVGFGGPHEPYDAPGSYATMYRPEDMPRPLPVPEKMRRLPEWVRAKLAFRIWPQATLDLVPQIRASYYGKISLIDACVGRILDAIDARGWRDDVLVVFLSDHGEMLGDHGRLKKSTFHESNVRIPLLMRWPARIPASTLSNALAEIVDVFPTLLEAAGCDPSSHCLGRTLWPVLQDPGRELREYQLCEVRYGDRQIMIRSRQHKFAIDSRGQGYMLYDLARDPGEQDNLILDAPARPLEQQLRQSLELRLREARYDPQVRAQAQS